MNGLAGRVLGFRITNGVRKTSTRKRPALGLHPAHDGAKKRSNPRQIHASRSRNWRGLIGRGAQRL